MQRAVVPRLDVARPGVRAAGLIPVALAAVTAVALPPVLGNGFVGLAVRLSLAPALLAAGRLGEVVGVIEGAWRFDEPAALAHGFGDVARHKPEAPVPRLGLVRAWLALGERERARAELEVLRGLHPGLAGPVVAGGEPS